MTNKIIDLLSQVDAFIRVRNATTDDKEIKRLNLQIGELMNTLKRIELVHEGVEVPKFKINRIA